MVNLKLRYAFEMRSFNCSVEPSIFQLRIEPENWVFWVLFFFLIEVDFHADFKNAIRFWRSLLVNESSLSLKKS